MNHPFKQLDGFAQRFQLAKAHLPGLDCLCRQQSPGSLDRAMFLDHLPEFETELVGICKTGNAKHGMMELIFQAHHSPNALSWIYLLAIGLASDHQSANLGI